MAFLMIRKDPRAALKERIFKINPYYWCAVNITIYGGKCTLGLHKVNMEISHKDPKVVNVMFNIISGIVIQGFTTNNQP